MTFLKSTSDNEHVTCMLFLGYLQTTCKYEYHALDEEVQDQMVCTALFPMVHARKSHLPGCHYKEGIGNGVYALKLGHQSIGILDHNKHTN